MSAATDAESTPASNAATESAASAAPAPVYFAPVLAGFEWLAEFQVGNAQMDDTHHEFVELLDRLIRASDGEFLARLDEFARHTEDHFEQEEQSMQELHFPPLHCHQEQHDNVLAAVREVREHVAGGDIIIGRYLAERIAAWFPGHADSMDRALARWIDYKQQGGEGAPELNCGPHCG